MKMFVLALVAATITLPVLPVAAVAGPVATAVTAPLAGQDELGRKSGRCASGESRTYVSGCSGV